MNPIFISIINIKTLEMKMGFNIFYLCIYNWRLMLEIYGDLEECIFFFSFLFFFFFLLFSFPSFFFSFFFLFLLYSFFFPLFLFLFLSFFRFSFTFLLLFFRFSFTFLSLFFRFSFAFLSFCFVSFLFCLIAWDINYDYLAKVTAMNLVTLANLGLSPSPPLNVAIANKNVSNEEKSQRYLTHFIRSIICLS